MCLYQHVSRRDLPFMRHKIAWNLYIMVDLKQINKEAMVDELIERMILFGSRQCVERNTLRCKGIHQ